MPKTSFQAKIEMRAVADLRARPDNPRVHNRKQRKAIAASIRQFGWTVPVLIDATGQIVAGHARVDAARELGLEEIPTICLSHLTSSELRAFAIAENRTSELGSWDKELLALNFVQIEQLDPEFDLTSTGFDLDEIELLQDVPNAKGKPEEAPCPAPDLDNPPVTRLGDLWIVGDHHRVLCGDACERSSYERLLGRERADMVVTDPPYNCAIQGHVGGLGKVKHREFVQASGEMTTDQFKRFLTHFMTEIARASRSGSVHFIFMDFRNIALLLTIGEAIYNQLLNVIV